MTTLDYHCQLDWLDRSTHGTSDYAAYDRRFLVRWADRDTQLAGSAEPHFRGDATLPNPEDLLLAATAACHMLTFLALCARSGLVVRTYCDQPAATLTLGAGGSGEITGIVLRPRISIADPAECDRALLLHEQAHARCFIARSLRCPVRILASIDGAG